PLRDRPCHPDAEAACPEGSRAVRLSVACRHLASPRSPAPRIPPGGPVSDAERVGRNPPGGTPRLGGSALRGVSHEEREVLAGSRPPRALERSGGAPAARPGTPELR